jgi:hypothetical protein
MKLIVRFGGLQVLLSHSINVTPQEAVVTEAIMEHLAMEEWLRKEHAAAGPNHG